MVDEGRAASVERQEAAAAVVARLDRRTKVRLLSGSDMFEVRGLPEHGLAPIAVADGPHGLRQQAGGGDHLGLSGSVPATCFPTAATLGSTWDVALVEQVGVALGEEAAEQGVAVVLGPGLNIKRHPAGGRCFEYLSEDPLLSGDLAAAMVRGIQSQGVGACLKHFAVNNQESHRLVVDAVLDERTLRELYLTGFERAVAGSAPWTVMCSYNLVNGTYASEHHELLQEVLRDEWGFDGLVMTDWGAANDRVAGVRAGLDLEMPGSGGAFDADLLGALESGALADGEVDRCAGRVVELLQRARRDRVPSDRDAHHRLGRRAAAAGSVLLRNEGGVLPLATDLGRLAVVGAFAEVPRYQGAGSSQVHATQVDRLLDLVRQRVGPGTDVAYAPGYDPETGSGDAAQLQAALDAAAGADVVVFCGGLPAPMESEGFDRQTLDLPAGQVALIEALAAGPAPVVVVLSNGGVVHLPWADRVDAVLEGWLGGQAGAGGTVDVLFGDVDPGGRLAESIPAHVAQLPADRNFPGQPRQVEHREGLAVGYRFHDTAGVAARYPFGHGLSYTTFDWTDAALEGSGTDVRVSVRVTNTGDRAGSDVVQVYVRDPEASVWRPQQELKGFAKVHLAPGASEVVTVDLDRRAFAVWDVAAHDWLVEAGAFEVVVARSTVAAVARFDHHVDSPDVISPVPPPAGLVMTDRELEAALGRPIPQPAPVRPFHRNSTLEDLETTAAGRALGRVVVRVGLSEAAREFPDPDAATEAMVRTALREGPIRGLVLLSGGRVPFAAVDALLAAFNRDGAGARRTVRRALRRRRT
ncbi:glycoside hydrolase family 3 C-terminal domain-containing protein [Aquihabitans sp. G128]|uniref:glycoside hydrolase family 3 C-terminal domain-containing protein n=1 Tax=Aquihabitans sp. G128 TaxID=2849779 RepID=UPI001C220039|nr:glycoside hydrolase family 3 C-terminal domain-containing protein [Aquihabitans sp. G128]QXC60851.1 glycoside hydrolase family 3 C-terminal domain-containing protein [Aquihabitans sp. G128]